MLGWRITFDRVVREGITEVTSEWVFEEREAVSQMIN